MQSKEVNDIRITKLGDEYLVVKTESPLISLIVDLKSDIKIKSLAILEEDLIPETISNGIDFVFEHLRHLQKNGIDF